MSTDRDILVTPESANAIKVFIRGGITLRIHVGSKLRIEVTKNGEIIKPEYSDRMEMLEVELEDMTE